MKEESLFFVIVIFLVIFFIDGVSAAVINATSCEQVDVQAAIDSAVDGDTVMVPAGECMWTSTVTIDKGITLIGAGIDSTVIKSNTGDYRDPLFLYLPADPVINEQFDLFGFTFDGDYNSYCVVIEDTSNIPITNVTVHHNKFSQCTTGLQIFGPVYGVAYNNSFYGTRDHTAVLGHNQRSHDYQTASFGTADAFFFEDNDFYGNGMMFQNSNGCQFTFRYNTIHDRDYIQIFDMHGNNHNPVMPGYTQARACLNGEVYENTIALTRGGGVNIFVLRGGSLLMYTNTFTHTVQSSYISLVDYDLTSDKLIPAIVSHEGTNYICLQDHTSSSGNEPGTSGGDAYWDVTAIVPNVYIIWAEGLDFLESEVYDPISDTYFYNNLENGDGVGIYFSDPLYEEYIVENEHYFLINPVGQTIKGNIYTPYTYPHPLTLLGTTCSPADTNTDGVVDITELMSYISQWKSGSVTIQELMTGIGEWKNGC